MKAQCVKCRGVSCVEKRVSARGRKFYYCLDCRVYFMHSFTRGQYRELSKLVQILEQQYREEHV